MQVSSKQAPVMVVQTFQELRHALDEERKANDQLIMQTDLDRGKIDDLEGR